MSEGWFVDPTGRFDGRFFNGAVWTDQVSKDGVLRTDPEWISEPTGAPTPAVEPQGNDSGFDGPERRSGRERRQVDMRQDVERRVSRRRNS